MPGLTDFLARIFVEGEYDFILFQEVRTRTSPPFDPLMTNILGSYSLLRTFNSEVNAWSELALAYRQSFAIEKSVFSPFAPYEYFGHPLPEFGLLIGKFATPEGRLLVGTLHMHPSIHALQRKRDVARTKEALLTWNSEGLPVIFGGDFNSGLIGEKRRNRRMLAPEFVNVTNDIGPTVDSRYVEPTTPLNALARAATKLLGFHLRMTVDHIYTDRATAESHVFSSRILPDRISDHSPLEVILKQH